MRDDSLIQSRPHSRKEAKLDTKTKLYQLNELAGKQTIDSVLSPSEFFQK